MSNGKILRKYWFDKKACHYITSFIHNTFRIFVGQKIRKNQCRVNHRYTKDILGVVCPQAPATTTWKILKWAWQGKLQKYSTAKKNNTNNQGSKQKHLKKSPMFYFISVITAEVQLIFTKISDMLSCE